MDEEIADGNENFVSIFLCSAQLFLSLISYFLFSYPEKKEFGYRINLSKERDMLAYKNKTGEPAGTHILSFRCRISLLFFYHCCGLTSIFQYIALNEYANFVPFDDYGKAIVKRNAGIYLIQSVYDKLHE